MLSQEIEISNMLGLHARASAKLVATASRYQSEIYLQKDDQRINGKSIMAVMMLAASKGTRLIISTEGKDEAQLLQAIIELIENKFGEGI